MNKKPKQLFQVKSPVAMMQAMLKYTVVNILFGFVARENTFKPLVKIIFREKSLSLLGLGH